MSRSAPGRLYNNARSHMGMSVTEVKKANKGVKKAAKNAMVPGKKAGRENELSFLRDFVAAGGELLKGHPKKKEVTFRAKQALKAVDNDLDPVRLMELAEAAVEADEHGGTATVSIGENGNTTIVAGNMVMFAIACDLVRGYWGLQGAQRAFAKDRALKQLETDIATGSSVELAISESVAEINACLSWLSTMGVEAKASGERLEVAQVVGGVEAPAGMARAIERGNVKAYKAAELDPANIAETVAAAVAKAMSEALPGVIKAVQNQPAPTLPAGSSSS